MNKENLSVVCVGSNIESLCCLQGFKDNNIRISGLVTLPFQDQARGSDYRDLVPFCNENNIFCLHFCVQVKQLRDIRNIVSHLYDY